MAFVLETGSGTPGANAYTTPAFVTSYLTDRAREDENDWAFKVLAEQQEAMASLNQNTGSAGTTNLGALLKAKLDNSNNG